jgi:hypothetical protein
MHESLDPAVTALVANLLASDGFSLVIDLLADSERSQLTVLRALPLGDAAKAAAVKLAHIEELRNAFRSVTPDEYGDPFDVRERPSRPPDP